MKDKIEALKAHVIKAAGKPSFIHHKWFVRYHLEIVDQIAHELLMHYPEADADLVETMVWLHDYGKILDAKHQHEETQTAGLKVLAKFDYPDDLAAKALSYVQIIDQHLELDLRQAPLEVRIVSSADSASHYVGPYFHLWWYDNPTKDYEELMNDNLAKVTKDWDRKMVLPEVREAFESRVLGQREQGGVLPERFLS